MARRSADAASLTARPGSRTRHHRQDRGRLRRQPPRLRAVRAIRAKSRLDRAPARRGGRVSAAITSPSTGSREACEQARRVLEGLYDQLKHGDELAHGDVDGAIRLALSQGSLFDFDSTSTRASFRGDQSAQASGTRAHRRAGRLYPRAASRHAGVRRRPRRHRQDLARGGACDCVVRAQGSRSHHPVATGGGSGRAARLPARTTCARRSILTSGRSMMRCST